jgi:GTP cyclohydrolase II
LHRIHLLTNHPRRIAGIEAYGLEVVECIPLGPAPSSQDRPAQEHGGE